MPTIEPWPMVTIPPHYGVWTLPTPPWPGLDPKIVSNPTPNPGRIPDYVPGRE